MLKQRINGKTVATLYVDGSQGDLDALRSIMEGAVEEFQLKASGGTAAPLPTVLDTRRVAVRKRDQNLSCSFRIRHLKDGKNSTDVYNAVVGKFYAHWDATAVCDDSELIYDNSRS